MQKGQRTKVWKRDDVSRIKERIREEVKDIEEPEERIAFFLERVAAFEDRDVDRLLYVHAALHTHLRGGGLSESQVRELLQLSQALLTFNNIKPKISALSFLLGELHVFHAQFHLSQGEALMAAVEHQLVQQLSGPMAPEVAAFQNLQLAQNVLRLGQADLAIDYAESALPNLAPELQLQAVLLKLRALRLSHRHDEAESWSDAISQMNRGEERFLRELAWERLCRQVQRQGSVDHLMQKLNPRNDFYHTSYVLEGFFWAHACASLQWIDHLPKLKSLGQKRQFNFKLYSNFHRCAIALEKCYDVDIPLTIRLANVKKTLQTIQCVPDVDKILLVYLSVIRWLLRSQCREFARILWSEYSGLSLRLSGGRRADALGIAADLQAKVWNKSEEVA